MTDLVERLREASPTARDYAEDTYNRLLLHEAADEIDRLRGVIEKPVAGSLDRLAELAILAKKQEQEIDRLTVNLGGSMAALKSCNDQIEQLHEQLDEATTEVERLRAALRQISYMESDAYDAIELAKIAQEALNVPA